MSRALVLLLVSLSSVYAMPALASGDCNYSLTESLSGEQVELRIDNSSTGQWTRLEFPADALPLQVGEKIEFKYSFSSEDVATFEYDGQTLVYEKLARSNFTKDRVVIETSPDLKEIRSVEYKRRMLYGLSLITGSETFTCP